MRSLPAHHIPRPRLAGAVMPERVVVVEAGGGYGKTTLAAEIVEGWRAVDIEVPLHEGGGSAAVFIARLRTGIARAGFPAAAAEMAAAGKDAHEIIDAALGALAAERCAFVVDDAQHAERETAVLIDWLAQRLQGEQRLVVLARRLPVGSERLRRAEFHQLQSSDLALRSDETLEVCRRGFGLTAGEGAIAALHSATEGWTAATVLSAARARRTGEELASIASAADAQHGQEAVATILGEALGALDEADLHRLAQVARLVPVARRSVDELGGDRFLDRVLAAGVPLATAGDDRWDLPGPVRDLLLTLAPPDVAGLRAVADTYAARGELGAAIELLLGIDEGDRAAGLLADAPPAALDALDILGYEALVDRIDGATLERHPEVLLHLARLYDGAALFEKRSTVLERLDQVAAAQGDGRILDALEVEHVTDLLRHSRYAEVEERATSFLARDEGADQLTTARALSVLARATCWQTDETGARDEVAMRRSNDLFTRAAACYRRAGLPTAAAGTVPYRAMWIDFALGNARAALATLDEGLGTVVERPRRWAFLQSFRSEVLAELGRYEEASDAARDVFAAGERLGDEELRAFGYWNRATIASHLGDGASVLELLRLTEQHPGEWFEPMSGDFLGDAADSLDRVGETSLAWEYLERALRDPKDGEPMIAMTQAALLARHGDPQRAQSCLADVFTHRVDPRERWRVMLFQAYATFRRGERGAGALAARAFEEAARIGLDQLPLTKEREVSEALLALAVETGLPAAVALDRASLPAALCVLGRFSLTRAGRPVGLSSGRGPQLLKLLAAAGGHLPAEVVIDSLWPDAELEAGRNRLRTTLSRLRSEGGDVVVRDGDTLSLAPDLRVDLHEFEREGRRALALGSGEARLAVAVATSAISRYRGDLLPGDPYEPWLERPRERARRIALELLDLCTDVATERGDLDEVRRVIELAIDLAPYDEHRYLRAASALLQQGRRGAALAVLARARSALAELGIPPPLDLVRIERRAAG
ncbi:MAG TPA: BTAD domain-containing putative transcriptional regulator [Solirubrobacteraceae bacterium]|jgi:DNA-binding SARP family transcriptional activator/tetratricopeptide (TPR) repeat protein